MAWELDAVAQALEEGREAGYIEGFADGRDAGRAVTWQRRDLVVTIILAGAAWSAVLMLAVALVMLL